MQRTVQALRERELIFVAERLVAKHQHCISVHPTTYSVKVVRRVNMAQVNAARFSSEQRVQGSERERHVCPPIEADSRH
jgi:hypothetical protein